MQFLKNKFVIIVIAMVVAVGVTGFMVARQYVSNPEQTFSQDGYVFGDPIETDDGMYIVPKIAFNAGTPYKTNYANQLVFESADKTKTTLQDFAFVHYQDGSTSSLRNGVLMDPFVIPENENVVCYNLAAGSTIQKNGSAYSISHLGNDITFDSIAMKVGEDNYIFFGNLVSLSLATGVNFDSASFAEVKFFDEGVMYIKLESGEAFYTVSPNCKLTIDGRTTVNLSERTIQNTSGVFALDQMIIDSSDNFSLSAGFININGVKIPEIIAEDGKAGEAGESGELGEPGEAGNSGDPGVAGSEGTEGAEGAGGASGASGPAGPGSETEDPGSGEKPLVSSLPDFTLPTLGVASPDDFVVSTSKGLSVDLTVSGTTALDYIDSGVSEVVAKVINKRTGEVLWQGDPIGAQTIDEQWGSSTISINVPPAPAGVNFLPDVEYELIVTGKYEYESQTYYKDFYKRTFVGGDIGINFGLKTVSHDTISITINKEAWSEVATLTASLYAPEDPTDPAGTISVILDDPFPAGGQTVTFNVDKFSTDFKLRPNTTYTIKLENLLSELGDTITSELEKTITVKTQLTINAGAVKVHKPNFSINRYDRSINVWPGQIEGLNPNSITKYTYQFYANTDFNPDGTLKSTATPVLELDSDNIAAQIANVAYSDGTDYITGLKNLLWNRQYQVRLVVDYFDNVTTRVFEGEFAQGVGISGALFPSMVFQPEMTPSSDPDYKYDAIKGKLEINTNGVLFTSGPNDGGDVYLTLQYRSTEKIGFSRTERYDLQGLQNGNTISLPIYVEGLMEDSLYTIVVYGYVDFSSGAGGSLTHIGSITIDDAGMTVGSLSALTVEANGFNSVLADMNKPVDFGQSGMLPSGVNLTGMMNAFFCLTDLDALVSSEYEAARLGEIEFTLHDGPNVASPVLGTPAKLVSTNSTPGHSTLGTGSTSLYNEDDSNYDNYYILTETDFGLIPDNLFGKTQVTIAVKRATDYTKHSLWSKGPNFYNEFPLGGTLSYTLTVLPVMPPLPDVDNALDYSFITEGNRTQFFTSPEPDFSTAALRPGYEPGTVIGFVLQAKFGMPSIATSFEYNLYRSKFERPNSQKLDLGPPSELDVTNRVQVFGPESYPVVFEKTSRYYNVIPRVIVLFGKQADYNIVDPADDATYYIYLGDIVSGYNEEGDARGYSYYATYNAVLQYDRDNPSDPRLNYPADYNLDGQSHVDTILYSHRLSAPLQKPIIKTYSASSDTGKEMWKYRMLDIDNAFLAGSLRANGVTSGPVTIENSDPTNPITLTSLTKSLTSSPTSYNDYFTINGLTEENFNVSYQFNTWRYTDASPPVSHQNPPNTQMMQWYHEEPYTIASGNQEILYDTFINTTRNRLYIVFPNMEDDIEDSPLFNRTAMASLSITRGSTTKTFNVPIGNALVFDKPTPPYDSSLQYLSAAIDLQTLSAEFMGQTGDLIVTPSLYYDSGRRGFELPTPLSYYALQSMRAPSDPVTDNPAGEYFSRGTSGNPIYTPAATGQYNFIAATGFTRPTQDPLAMTTPDPGKASLSYRMDLSSTPRPMVAEYTLGERGARDSSGKYVVPKALARVNAALTSGGKNSFELPLLVPEVYDFLAVPGLQEVTIDYRIEGLSVLEGYNSVTPASGTAVYTFELFRRDPVGASYNDVRIGTFTSTTITAPTTEASMPTGSGLGVSSDPQTFKFYIGTATGTDVPVGYTKLKLDYTNMAGTPHFDGLETSKLYFFRLSGVINRDPGGTDTVLEPFFDNQDKYANRDYQFRTSDNVKIGGETGLQVNFNYRADAYNSKKIEVTYPLNGPSREYYIEYVFTKTSDTTKTYTYRDPRTIYTVGGAINTQVIPMIPSNASGTATDGSYSFFEFDETYSVKLVARTTSTNDLIGESQTLTYKLSMPIDPQFVATTTPIAVPDGIPPSGTPGVTPQNYATDISINPIDPSASITGTVDISSPNNFIPAPASYVNSEYFVRIYNSVGKDVTADIQARLSGSTTFPLSTHIFSFNKNDQKIQKFTIPGSALQSAAGYTLNIYAITDKQYTGPTFDGYSSLAGVLTDVNNLTMSATDLNRYFVRSIEFTVHNEDEVNVGDVTVAALASSTRLIFENQINLHTATTIQYSITNLGTEDMPIASAPIAFVMTPSADGTYMYFDLPAVISAPGLYQIELRFSGPGVNREKTINFRKTS